ncbi:MAG: hypothetical protein ACI4F0_07470 [Agathobacter sp.]
MRKRTKQHGLSMLAGLLMMAMLAGWMLSGPFEVEAVEEETTIQQVSDAATWKSIVEGSGDAYIQLTENFTVSELSTCNRTGTLIIDLNGKAVSDTGGKGVLKLTSGTLTITDSSTGGTITSNASSVGTIEVTNGILNIKGGKIKAGTYTAVNAVSNSKVYINGGHLTGAYSALNIGSSCEVTITRGSNGDPQLDSASIVIYMPSASSGSELTIQGGTLSATNSSSYAYVCEIDGANNVFTVTGGTFTLNANSGSTLVIGANMSDANVSISGGTYNGRIARMLTPGKTWDYSTYYGGGPFDGIIASRSMLTNNSLCDNGENAVFTADNVSVVPGALLMFNTRRSSLETYEKKQEANLADFLSISPIVKKDGTIEVNSDANEIPTVDTTKIPAGNTYTFQHWIDSNNRVYASSAEYLAQNSLEGNTILRAVWTASCETLDGMNSVTQDKGVVSSVSGNFNLNNGTEYTLGAGSWTVTGDNTVYSGGQSFYVTESGNYGFQRR